MKKNTYQKKRNQKIVILKEKGASYNELARKFNVSPQRIQHIYATEKMKKAVHN